MKNLITRIIHRIPKYKKDVWWNQSYYMDTEYPIVEDDNGVYLRCVKGQEVIMGETKDGKKIMYEVVKAWSTRGSDWLCSSDSHSCDLKFKRLTNS